jgi:hypothetical protein
MGDAVEESSESYVAQEEIVIFFFFFFLLLLHTVVDNCKLIYMLLVTHLVSLVNETVWVAYS